jgi:hypothetical protein
MGKVREVKEYIVCDAPGCTTRIVSEDLDDVAMLAGLGWSILTRPVRTFPYLGVSGAFMPTFETFYRCPVHPFVH